MCRSWPNGHDFAHGTFYIHGMWIMCLLGRHRPSPVSMARHADGLTAALCEPCGVPLTRTVKGAWRAALPQASPAPARSRH
ncbi:hypothetical protein TQ38_027000 (plasmid) [Novosphingobium sp. P6W]|nr:hypothetical protein TQ38_027000 [Novosphingobium sp. P6W]